MSKGMVVDPLTTSIGARVTGVDLRALSAGDADGIRQALDRHAVVVFSGQGLNLEEQCRFATTFGALEPLPTLKFLGWEPVLVVEGLIKHARERPPTLQWAEHQGWHTDSSFTAQVPRAAVLRAEIIPPVGGGTSWTSMCAAFEALSDEMQRWLSTLKAVHAYPPGYKESIGLNRCSAEEQQRFDEKFPPWEHPVVFTHPRSGRCGLFVNPTYTTHIVGLTAKESRNILNFLFTHIATPDFVYRHRWIEGDIVVWDELATLHLAPDDHAPHRRRVVRVTAGLETPTSPI